MGKKTKPPGARISAELSDVDYALPGTLSRRFMRCGKANCRCKADPLALHGPYLHWTRTVAGKTVTRTLTPDQAARYQTWFDNARRLRDVVTDIEARSLDAFNTAEGPPSKSPR
ncbi:MAG: DUF6788 family protein [Microbacteriaceae bacterium]